MDPSYFQHAINPTVAIFVAVVVIASIIGCAIFLFSQSKAAITKPGEKVGTMDHTWDGDLQEFNNPLPSWWRNLFVITIVFGLIYLALYPGLAVFAGFKGWTSAGQLAEEASDYEKKLQSTLIPWAKTPLEQLAKNTDAMNSAKHLFLNNCARCHASDAGGNNTLGYPRLTDKDWLWGGTPEDINHSITEGRLAGAGGGMPAHKEILKPEQISQVSNYVLSLSGAKHEAGLASLGKATFDTSCAVCHGADGKGNRALGAPNLTDNIWLYGNSYASIYETIANGRQNKMPAWKDILGPERIHLLSAYVWSLGGGEPSATGTGETSEARRVEGNVTQ